MPRRLLRIPLSDGRLHRWAAADYVLGNPDRNAGNMMVRGADVKLIDHGTTMAGAAFDPAGDRYSFVPFYLRAWAPPNFAGLAPLEQLAKLPRLGPQAAEALKGWLQGLDVEALGAELTSYGIDPAPAQGRLRRLQAGAQEVPADLVINQAWVLP